MLWKRSLPAVRRVLILAVVVAASGCYEDAVRALTCGSPFNFSVVNPNLNYFGGDEVSFRAYWEDEDTEGCPSLANVDWGISGNALELNGFTGETVTGLALQPGTSQITATVEDFSASLDFTVDPRGFTLGFGGLPAGGPVGMGTLTSPSGTTYDFSGTTSMTDVEPGVWEYELQEVTDFHTFRGDPAVGTFEVGRDLNLQATANYTQYTGQLNFRAVGVADGVTGTFGSLTFGNQTVELTQPYEEFAVPPGPIAGVYLPLDPDGFNYSPSITDASGSIESGEELTVEVDYEATRGRVDLSSEGIPEGATGMARVTGNGVDMTVDVGSEVYLEPGSYQVEVDPVEGVENQAEQRTEDYAPVTPIHQFDILAGQIFTVAIAYQLMRYFVAQTLAWTILLDPHGHHPFVTSLRVGLILLAIVQYQSTADLPAQAAPRPIEIAGPPGWVPLEGTVDAEGNVTASGSGTVAGFPDVPVVLDGTLDEDGSLNAEVTVGSETPPTGLPNGPIIYSITGTPSIPQIAPAGAP